MLRKIKCVLMIIFVSMTACSYQVSTANGKKSATVTPFNLPPTWTPPPTLTQLITPSAAATEIPIPTRTSIPTATSLPISLSEYNETYFVAHDVDFSPDGQFLAVANDAGVWLWKLSDLEHTISSFESISHPPQRLAFSHTGQLLIISGCSEPDQYFICEESQIHIIRLQDLEITSTLSVANTVRQIEFSPNDLEIIVQVDNQVVFLNLASGQLIEEFENLETDTNSFSIDPDGLTVATSSYTKIFINRIDKSQEAATLTGVLGGIGYGISLSYSADGKYLAAGGCTKFDFENCVRGEVRIWDVENQEIVRILTGFSTRVGSIAFSPNGKLIAAASYKKLLIWDLQTNQSIYIPEVQNLQIFDIKFSADSSSLAIASNTGLHLVSIPN